MIFNKLFRVNNLLKLFTLFPLVSIRQENIVVSLSELRTKVLDDNEKKNHYFMFFIQHTGKHTAISFIENNNFSRIEINFLMKGEHNLPS